MIFPWMTSDSKGIAGVRFWPVALSVVALDALTKWFAVAALSPMYEPHDVVGDVVRLTLAYNEGIAFGIPAGGALARWILGAAAFAVVIGMWRAARRTPATDWSRVLALALIAGGAAGNGIDRIRWARGVVDFIDLGVGGTRFWTFNVADAALTCGALLLILVLKERPQVTSQIESDRP
jgi:signal peptidase II